MLNFNTKKTYNILYAMRINKHAEIKHCPSARAWFAKHLQHFILISIMSGGTYPVLCLCSSRIFGLDFFNAGLLSDDLHKLSKIKMRSTIYLENVPQLLIQVIYSFVIGDVENATMLAFIASSLSVIASVVIYQAYKEQNAEVVVTKYYIRFAAADYNMSGKEEANILFYKGLKMKLGESLCGVFNLPNKSIEIGFVTPNTNGCIIHLQHSIFKDNLKELKEKLFAHKIMNYGINLEITPELYVENLYKLYVNKINRLFRKHFDINNDKFVASYHRKYEDANSNYKKTGNTNTNATASVVSSSTFGIETTDVSIHRVQSNMINQIASKLKKQQTQQNLTFHHKYNELNEMHIMDDHESKDGIQIEMTSTPQRSVVTVDDIQQNFNSMKSQILRFVQQMEVFEKNVNLLGNKEELENATMDTLHE